MRAELRKAIALKPDFPESYALLGFINVVRNEEVDETIKLLKRVVTMSRSNERVVFMLAQLYMCKQDFAEARRLRVVLQKFDFLRWQRAYDLVHLH